MRILMTGCCTGFGKYVRERLLEQGHDVYGTGLNGPDWWADFTSLERDELEDNIETLFSSAEFALGGPIEVLINNAGLTKIDFMENHEYDDFLDVMTVNLTVPFLLSRELVRRVSKEEAPLARRIVSTSSMGVLTGLRASPGYVASKAGLEAMTRTMAKEFAGRYPITAVCIAPGGVDDTKMVDYAIHSLMRTRGFTKEQAEQYNRQSPLGRNCTHDEVWQMFDFCVNKMPVYCSGETFHMKGGLGV